MIVRSYDAGGRIKSNKNGYGGRRTRTRADEARDVLISLVFSHVPVVHFNFQPKVSILDADNSR